VCLSPLGGSAGLCAATGSHLLCPALQFPRRLSNGLFQGHLQAREPGFCECRVAHTDAADGKFCVPRGLALGRRAALPTLAPVPREHPGAGLLPAPYPVLRSVSRWIQAPTVRRTSFPRTASSPGPLDDSGAAEGSPRACVAEPRPTRSYTWSFGRSSSPSTTRAFPCRHSSFRLIRSASPIRMRPARCRSASAR
jgi:hypothetical protein